MFALVSPLGHLVCMLRIDFLLFAALKDAIIMSMRIFVLALMLIARLSTVEAQATLQDVFVPAYDLWQREVMYHPFRTDFGADLGVLDSVVMTLESSRSVDLPIYESSRYVYSTDSIILLRKRYKGGRLDRFTTLEIERPREPHTVTRFTEVDGTIDSVTTINYDLTGEMYFVDGRRDSVVVNWNIYQSTGLAQVYRRMKLVYDSANVVTATRFYTGDAGLPPRSRFQQTFERDSTGDLRVARVLSLANPPVESSRIVHEDQDLRYRQYRHFIVRGESTEPTDFLRMYKNVDSIRHFIGSFQTRNYVRIDRDVNPYIHKYLQTNSSRTEIHTYYYKQLFTGLNDITPLPATVRFPNPISQVSAIEIVDVPRDSRYRIITSAGQTVTAGRAYSGEQVEWEANAAGIYYLVLDAPGYPPRGWTVIAQ